MTTSSRRKSAKQRRSVLAAGGYFCRASAAWVLPGARHNCTPWSTGTQWFSSLEEAAEAAEAAKAANKEVYDFGRAEAAYLRANR